MGGFSKVFELILDSSLWSEDYPTRIVFLTMILIKDKDHVVRASLHGLARRANVTMDEAKDAISKLSSPDPDSSNKDHDGRRIVPVDGGWLVTSGEKYRKMMSEDDRRERDRQRKARARADACGQTRTDVDRPSLSANSNSQSQSQSQSQTNPPTPPDCPSSENGSTHPAVYVEFKLACGRGSQKQLDEQVDACLAKGVTIERICSYIHQNRGLKVWEIGDALIPPAAKCEQPSKPVRSFDEMIAAAQEEKARLKGVKS